MARDKTKAEQPAPASPTAAADMSRRQQFVETYRMTKKSDRGSGWILLASFVLAAGLGFAVFGLLLPASASSAGSSPSPRR